MTHNVSRAAILESVLTMSAIPASRFDEMDESEARAMYAEWSRRADEAKQRRRADADAFTTARKLSERAAAVLRDRFAVCPKTGRRLKRKARDLLSLAG